MQVVRKEIIIDTKNCNKSGDSVLSKVSKRAKVTRSCKELSNGKVVEERYVGLTDEPVVDAYSCAKRTWTYDASDRLIEECFYGLAGEPVVHTMYGCAKVISDYNAGGQLCATRYLGLAGEPVVNKRIGCAKILTTYDASGRMSAQCFLGLADEPVTHKIEKCVMLTWSYASNKTKRCCHESVPSKESIVHVTE